MYIIVFINAFLILLTISYCTRNFANYIKERESFSTLQHYEYIPIHKNLENQIKQIDNYIESTTEDVIILDASAAVYMVPINRYHKDYDMLNKGNLGKDGEQRIIEEISKKENTQYLILKDGYNKNWQTPLEIVNYVQSNKNKIGEIGVFDIYE